MKVLRTISVGEPQFSAPALEDGPTIHQLAVDAGTLDVNSEYAYLLLGMHHSASCVLAHIDGRPAGFVSGYIVPERYGPSVASTAGRTLFIWQAAVHPDFRGRGLATDMLHTLLKRPENRLVRFIETTIGSSNNASIGLFQSLAKKLGKEMIVVSKLGTELFRSPHEAETVYRIGPFNLSTI